MKQIISIFLAFLLMISPAFALTSDGFLSNYDELGAIFETPERAETFGTKETEHSTMYFFDTSSTVGMFYGVDSSNSVVSAGARRGSEENLGDFFAACVAVSCALKGDFSDLSNLYVNILHQYFVLRSGTEEDIEVMGDYILSMSNSESGYLYIIKKYF